MKTVSQDFHVLMVAITDLIVALTRFNFTLISLLVGSIYKAIEKGLTFLYGYRIIKFSVKVGCFALSVGTIIYIIELLKEVI